MIFILRKMALFQCNIMSFLFILPLLLPNVLVTSHAPILEQYTLNNGDESDHPHSHSEPSNQIGGHSHGHNSSDHLHGSVMLIDGNSLVIESAFALNFIYLNFYYPPHLKLPEQPPKQYA